jgi:hypothetical protein
VIGLFQLSVPISQLQLRLRNKWNISIFELDLQAFLVDSLQKPAAHAFINLETGAKYGIYFICTTHKSLENELLPTKHAK